MLKIINNAIFVYEVFTIKLGAICCRRTEAKTGVKTLKSAVIYDVMNKTCCRVDWNDPGGKAFALYFLYPPLGI